MKKAKVTIVSVAARCPYCDSEDVFDPESGSYNIDVAHYSRNDVFECNDCRNKFQLEAKAWR